MQSNIFYQIIVFTFASQTFLLLSTPYFLAFYVPFLPIARSKTAFVTFYLDTDYPISLNFFFFFFFFNSAKHKRTFFMLHF